MKRFKKMNSGALQILVMGLIVPAFVYMFYHFYDLYRDYRETRGKDKPPAAESEKVQPPVFYSFDPGNNDKYQLFTFKEKKQKPKKGEKMVPGTKTEQAKPPDYSILGVVKRDRLYLVVRFHSGNRLGFIPQGGDINRGHRVERLESFQVVISDRAGREYTHKIFKLTNIRFKEMPHDKKKRK
jgi:hypothetical protein